MHLLTRQGKWEKIAKQSDHSLNERRCPLLVTEKQLAKQRKQMTIDQIKLALKMGQVVNWKCSSYIVTFRATTDELFVLCRLNSHMVGVGRWHQASDFYIGGAK